MRQTLYRMAVTLALGSLLAAATAGAAISSEKEGKVQRRADMAPRVGDRAPDFEVATLDGKRKVKLSSFRWKKDVVLVFGSYT